MIVLGGGEKMKKQVLKKGFSVTLCMVMMFSLVSVLPGNISKVLADTTPQTKNINLGTDCITAGQDNQGSKIYFGSNSTPILWRTMVKDSTSATLLSNEGLGTRDYDSSGHHYWSGSDICKWLNSTDIYASDGFLTSVFTLGEQVSINPYNPAGTMETDTTEYGPLPTIQVDQNIVLPSVAEASNWFTSDSARADGMSSLYWWLRSICQDTLYPAAVESEGGIAYAELYYEARSVRPAFKLNLSSVLFTSASGVSKSSFGVVENDQVGSNTWKLTLKGTDSNLNGAISSGKTSFGQGYLATDINVSHSAANILPDATQVSAMLTDSNETILYYGSVNSDTSATSSQFTIPTGLAAGNYNLYVFAEDVNGGNLTDYASALGNAIPITVSTEPETYAVTVNSGTTANSSYSAGETVTITANAPASGKQFKDWTVVSGGITLASSTSSTTTFTMPANAVEVTANYEDEQAVTPQIVDYKMLEGANGTYTKGVDTTYRIKANGKLSKFKGLMMDGELVDSEHYSAESGSTIITFSAAYMNTLSLGKHSIQVNYTDGSAKTKVTVVEASTTNNTSTSTKTTSVPKTGDSNLVSWFVCLVFVSGTGIVFLNRKRFMSR